MREKRLKERIVSAQAKDALRASPVVQLDLYETPEKIGRSEKVSLSRVIPNASGQYLAGKSPLLENQL